MAQRSFKVVVLHRSCTEAKGLRLAQRLSIPVRDAEGAWRVERYEENEYAAFVDLRLDALAST